MSKTGLVSVTFRPLSPQAIIELCLEAKVDAIEWGGDIHVPHGDLVRASDVGKATREAGLEVAAYGSYYRSVESEKSGLYFNSVLKTAKALGAPTIRVWAGGKDSADASAEYRRAVAEDLRSIAEQAAQEGIRVSVEFHGGTLTDFTDSAVDLFKAVDHPNLKSLWQPACDMTDEEQDASLKAMLPWLDYFHAYYWTGSPPDVTRRAISEGADRWKSFFEVVTPPYALVEFVKDDKPEQFLEDAKALKALLS